MGDEFHYLLVCPHFDNDRRKFLGGKVIKNSVYYKCLMQCDQISALSKLSKLCNAVSDEFKHARKCNTAPTTVTNTDDQVRTTRSGRTVKRPTVLDL